MVLQRRELLRRDECCDERGHLSERGRDNKILHPVASRQQHKHKISFLSDGEFCRGAVYGGFVRTQ